MLGHRLTLLPFLKRIPLRPLSHAKEEMNLIDPMTGEKTIRWDRCTLNQSRELLVLVHGLGGNAQSPYLYEAEKRAHLAGYDILRINQRGTDGHAEDIYHAGLYEDLEAVLRDPRINHYEHIDLIGFSLGGHMALHFAAKAKEPRLKRVAAICSPLDLNLASRSFDSPRCTLYRWNTLYALNQMISALTKSKKSQSWLQVEKSISKIRQWDTAYVARRFGYASAEDYYEVVSAKHQLEKLQVPTLLLHTQEDPVVFYDDVSPYLSRQFPKLDHYLLHGGHLGFAPGSAENLAQYLNLQDSNIIKNTPAKLQADQQVIDILLGWMRLKI